MGKSYSHGQGDIYWLDDCEPLQGDIAKRRPVVVVSTETMKAQMGGVLVVVACTTTVYADDIDAVELPHRGQSPQTHSGLLRQTSAIPQWYLFVKAERLTGRAGFISGKLLAKVVARFLVHYQQDT